MRAFLVTALCLSAALPAAAARLRAEPLNSQRFAGRQVESPAELAAVVAQQVPAMTGGHARLVKAAAFETLTGSHAVLQQFAGGLRVTGVAVVAHADRKGRVTAVRGLVIAAALPERGRPADVLAAIRSLTDLEAGEITSRESVWHVLESGEVFAAERVRVVVTQIEQYDVYVGSADGNVLEVVPLFHNVSGRVFALNPIEKLGLALHDTDDSATAVPEGAYSTEELPGLQATGALRGPHVMIAEMQEPVRPLVSAQNGLLFDRANDGFEQVMAYFHIDASQRYLQALGYTGPRQIVPYAIAVDVHAANGEDNSYYQPTALGRGSLFFGEGGVDDAEDPDVILHEYGHAIQDSLSPSAFSGGFSTESRAMGEGFSDYWAFSSSYEGVTAHGGDPFCIADWDARCGGGPSSACSYAAGALCLRRVDSTKTMADYQRVERRGIEHQNGQIWSSALREIFMTLVAQHGAAAGKRISDILALEGSAGLTSRPTYATVALRMLEADRLLFAGANAQTVCSAMSLRGILPASSCTAAPRGEQTMVQSPVQDVAIPDYPAEGIVSTVTVEDPRAIHGIAVHVEISHPFSGDLRIDLEAPDGRVIRLRNSFNAPGADLLATYGIDTAPAEPLTPLVGMPAAGLWKLRVTDNASRDAGRLRSWSLLLTLQGDQPLATRDEVIGESLVVPVIARTAGAVGSEFFTDTRVANLSNTSRTVNAFFTRSGANGSTDFSAVKLKIGAQQTLVLDDIVTRLFRAGGVGSLELRGDVSTLRVSSRTYNRAAAGTFGQAVPAASRFTTAGGQPIVLAHLRNDAEFRTNVGFTETTGGSGSVQIQVFAGSGELLQTIDLGVLPFSHSQVGILGGIGGTQAPVARVVMRVVQGDAKVTGYASVIDNRTNDPFYTEPVSGAAVAAVPAAYRVGGANGTFWRSDLVLTTAGAPATAQLKFFPAGGGAPLMSEVPLSSGETRLIEDLLKSRLGLEEAVGHLQVTGAVATTRVFTQVGEGTYGQLVPARDVADSRGAGEGQMHCLDLSSDGSFRTNIGFAEVSGSAVIVRVTLVDPAGTVLGTREVTLPALGQAQIGASSIVPSFRNARAVIEVMSGEGRVLAYASVIDNATGDPVYIPAH